MNFASVLEKRYENFLLCTLLYQQFRVLTRKFGVNTRKLRIYSRKLRIYSRIYAFICESYALIRESYALIREKYIFFLYENEPNRLSQSCVFIDTIDYLLYFLILCYCNVRNRYIYSGFTYVIKINLRKIQMEVHFLAEIEFLVNNIPSHFRHCYVGILISLFYVLLFANDIAVLTEYI